MNTLTSTGTDNLPQAALPPEPQKQVAAPAEEPLFEEVKVVQESAKENASLDKIAQKLKEESIKENAQSNEVQATKAPEPAVEKPKAQAVKQKTKERLNMT